MSLSTCSAAAWAAPLLAVVEQAAQKQTHKLAPQICVLWLPDYGAYLKTLDLSSAKFTVSRSPERALRLADELAETVGQNLIEVTGVRAHLRLYTPTH
jgi:hypothetical protein